MAIQRYFFTALLAGLLWPLLAYFFDRAMFDALSADSVIAVYLVAGVVVGTILGIWTIDALTAWSSGKAPLIGLYAAATRAGIGIVAATIFSLWFWKLLHYLELPISFVEIIRTRGMTVVAAAWIAAQIVDLLKRDPMPPKRR